MSAEEKRHLLVSLILAAGVSFITTVVLDVVHRISEQRELQIKIHIEEVKPAEKKKAPDRSTSHPFDISDPKNLINFVPYM